MKKHVRRLRRPRSSRHGRGPEAQAEQVWTMLARDQRGKGGSPGRRWDSWKRSSCQSRVWWRCLKLLGESFGGFAAGRQRCCWFVSPQDRVGLPTGCVSGVRCRLEVVHTLFHSLIKFVSDALLPKIEFPAPQITRSLDFSEPPGLLVLQILAHEGEQRKVTNSKACCPLPPRSINDDAMTSGCPWPLCPSAWRVTGKRARL